MPALDDKIENINIASTDEIKGILKTRSRMASIGCTPMYTTMDHLSYYGESDYDKLPEKQQDEIQRLVFARKQEFKKRKP